MATYQTKNGVKSGFVPGVGPIVDGLLKNAPDDLESPNLLKVAEASNKDQTQVNPAPAAPVASQTSTPQPPTNTQTTNTQTEEKE